MSLFSGTIQNLENALSRADIKQKVITNNIANIDTPNYKAKKVSFQNLLDQESSRLEAIKQTIVMLIFLILIRIIQLLRAEIHRISKTETMLMLTKR